MRWNTNALSVALLVLLGFGCSDDAAPMDDDPQAEAGSGGSMPSAGKDSKAGAGGSGGSAGKTSSPAGAGGTDEAGSGGKPAADGGKGGTTEAGRGGEPGAGTGGSAGEAAPNASEIAAALAAAICEALEACVGPQKLAALNGREDCTERLSASMSQDDFGSLDASIEAGTVKLDPSQLEACYDDTRQLGCKVQTERLPESCSRAIAGQQAAGERCSIGADCTRDTFCPIDAECPRNCEPARDEGGECMRDAECQRGTICAGGVCAAPALKGQACAGDSGATCAFGLSCVGSTDVKAGTCQTNASVQAGALGATCTPGGTLCQEGLSCAFDSGSTFKCVGPVERGATCKLSLPTQCPLDSYCDAEDVTVNGTCEALPTDGMACVLGDDCAPGHLCVTEDGAAVCRKLGDIGEPCDAAASCRSGFCDAGSCGLRARCE